ncbi:MAG: hypothetical protein KGL39_46355, partial [Patescibacteria group bacterium]|nr:hypothetical protein [Patescibacteria group bacterium]
KIVPQMNVMLGETVFEAIERLCRFSAMLVYDQPDGNIVLAQVGSGAMASGLTEGQNVQGGSVSLSMAERFSEYVVSQLSMDVLGDAGDGGLITETVYDKGVPRKRVRYVIVESGDAGGDIAKLRAQWEAARRYGRSQIAHVVADSWRDAAGALWSPNMLASLQLPTLRIASARWVIASVTYRRGPGGSTAELELMPPKAFAVEPVLAPWEAGLMDVPAGVAP